MNLTKHNGQMILVALLLMGGVRTSQATCVTVQAGNWTNSSTWAAGAVPVEGDDVVVNHAVMLSQETPALHSFSNTATLTCTGWTTQLLATEVYVNGTITHPAQSALSTDGSGAWVPDNRVSIICSNLTVAKTASINGNMNGFIGVKSAVGRGPGGGAVNMGSVAGGGGYGGSGGFNGGRVYGMAQYPTNAGSAGGGAGNDGGKRGGNGGGIITIIASGHVKVEGTISADGESGAGISMWVAGGSGGSVSITCKTIGGASTGLISVKGGLASAFAGGGGGGRIALHYDSTAQSNVPLSEVCLDASGGAPSVAAAGCQGSIYLTDATFFPAENLKGGHIVIPGFTSWSPSQITISGGVVSFEMPFALHVAGRVTLSNYGGLELSNSFHTVGADIAITNGTITLSGATNAVSALQCGGSLGMVGGNINIRGSGTNAARLVVSGALNISSNATINLYSSNATFGYDPLSVGVTMGVTGAVNIGSNTTVFFHSDTVAGGIGLLSAGSLTIDVGATLNANGLGFGGGTALASGGNGYGKGPGGGAYSSNTGGGGAYGGVGGASSAGALGGAVYGQEYAKVPAQPGSGGGGRNNANGSNAGGAIRLAVEGVLTVNGTITADGAIAADSSVGAGSGGSVYIVTRRLRGNASGLISADGGNATGGGSGGGGRVAIWRMSDNFEGSVTVNPGSVGTGAAGGIGSVELVMIPPFGTVISIR